MDVNELSTLFDDMKRLDISSHENTPSGCKERFQEVLRKWNQKRRHLTSSQFSAECKQNDKGCLFNLRAFKRAGVYEDQFRKEVKVWTDLAQCQPDITPTLHQSFFCGRYGLLVSDNWTGDLVDFLQTHEDFRSGTKFQQLCDAVHHMVSDLHSCGYVHGKLNTRAVVFDTNGDGPRFHLINYEHARKTTRARSKAKDLRQLNHMFEELHQLYRHAEVHEILPLHLQYDFQR